MDYKHLIYTTQLEAENRANKVLIDCNYDNGLTYKYAEPLKHPIKDLWAIPLIDGYINYFTKEEVIAADYLPDEWYLSPEVDFLTYHKIEVEAAVDKLVNNVLLEYWYNSIGDVAAIAINPDSIWNQEAIALNEWYNNIYEALKIYKDNVNLQNYMQIDAFISTLPSFIEP